MLQSLGSKIPLEKGQEPCAGAGLLGASGSLQGAEQGAAGSDTELRRGLIQDARCFLDIPHLDDPMHCSQGCEDEQVPL